VRELRAAASIFWKIWCCLFSLFFFDFFTYRCGIIVEKKHHIQHLFLMEDVDFVLVFSKNDFRV